MGNTLAKILLGAAMFFSFGCALTPTGRAFGQNLLLHAGKEKISRELNPHEINVSVHTPKTDYSHKTKQDVLESIRRDVKRERELAELINRLKAKKVYKPEDHEYLQDPKRVGNILPPPSYTCSEFKDANENGHIERSEVKGLKSYFECKTLDTPIVMRCVSRWAKAKGKTITCKIKETATGKIAVVNDIGTALKEYATEYVTLTIQKEAKDEGIRSYTMEWYLDGKNMPSRTMEFFIDYGAKEQAELEK